MNDEQPPQGRPPWDQEGPAQQPSWESQSQQPQPEQWPAADAEPSPRGQEAGSEAPTDVFPSPRNVYPLTSLAKPNVAHISVLAVLAVVVIILAVGTARNRDNAAAAPPAEASPTASAVTRATPAATTAPAAVTGQTVAAWWDGAGKSDVHAVITALDATRADATAGRMPAMAKHCAQFAAAVAKLRAAGPTPNLRAQKWLAQALTHWSAAAARCPAGTTAPDAASVLQVSTDMQEGRADMRKATAVIDRLIGPQPTAPPG